MSLYISWSVWFPWTYNINETKTLLSGWNECRSRDEWFMEMHRHFVWRRRKLIGRSDSSPHASSSSPGKNGSNNFESGQCFFWSIRETAIQCSDRRLGIVFLAQNNFITRFLAADRNGCVDDGTSRYEDRQFSSPKIECVSSMDHHSDGVLDFSMDFPHYSRTRKQERFWSHFLYSPSDAKPKWRILYLPRKHQNKSGKNGRHSK